MDRRRKGEGRNRTRESKFWWRGVGRVKVGRWREEVEGRLRQGRWREGERSEFGWCEEKGS